MTDVRAQRYSDAAITSELDALRNTTSGRNAALNKAAFALGGFVAAGAMREEDAIKHLEQACEANGYTRKDGQAQVRASIRSGLRKGIENPRELPRSTTPDNQQNGRPKMIGRRRQALADLSAERAMPLEFLQQRLRWKDTPRGIAIPYLQRDGTPARTQYRDTPNGRRFEWDTERESLPIVAYEPDGGALAREKRFVLICEGAMDAATAYFATLPAVGVPGVDMVRKTLLPHHFEAVTRVFVCIDTNEVGDPDDGGSKFREKVPEHLRTLGYTGGVHELRMPGAKDMSALWVKDPERFAETLDTAMREAVEGPRPAYVLLSDSVGGCLRPVGQRLLTGFAALDEATRGGIPLGRVVGLNGAPGAGKSTLLAQLADDFEQQGCAVVYLAVDEASEGIIIRLGQRAGFSRDALESEGAAGDSVRAGFAERVRGRLLSVIDPDQNESMRTVEDAERALLHMAGDKPRVLIIDSVQTARCSAADGAESARERIDALISTIKGIAKRGTLVLFASEMARSGYRTGDRNTDTSALAAGKESGAIEYGCALLLGLRSVKGEHGLVDVEVAKNRVGGAKPEFRLRLDPERANFEQVAKPEGDDEVAIKRARFAKLRADILAAVKGNRLTSATEIYTHVRGTKSEVLAEIRDLKNAGTLVQVDGVIRVAAGRSGGTNV